MTLLIIEDDIGLIELVKEKVEECGYEVVTAQTAKEALKWLEDNTPNLMILDYSLPDMNGKEFISELKRKEQPLPAFIVSTGQGDERIAVEMMKLGAKDYIIKDRHFLEMLPLVIRKVDKDIENEKKIKLSEIALKESEKLLRQAQEISHIGHFKYNPITKYFEGSDEFFYILGLDKENFNFSDFVKLIPLDQRPFVVETIKTSIEQTKGYDIEHQLLLPNGTLKYVNSIGEAIREVHTGQSLLIGTIQDISERKRGEKALLENERLTSIAELALGVAHNFNNALQIIFGNIELALLDADISKKVNKYLNTMKSSAIDAAVRVQQLQRFARKGNRGVDYNTIDIHGLLDSAIEQTKPEWKDKAEKNGINISIQKKYGEIKSVDGNSGEIRTVLSNIIKNSIEAMPNGGKISFETGSINKGVYLRITDTGIGMDEEIKKRIFQPFYTTKGFELGKGLGLSTVYAIIRDHGGEIFVKESIPGKGTTIEFILPFGTMDIESAAEKTKNENMSSAKVLWVDDDEAIRDVGEMMLQVSGHEATVAASGEEALKLLENNSYDLIITDLGMPNMNGWELAEKIKERYKGAKVAVVTGWGSDITQAEKEKYGIGYMLGKPIAKKDLDNLVMEVLQFKNKL